MKYDKALDTMLATRFVAKAEELGRDLTDDEVRSEAEYQYNDLPFKPDFEEEPYYTIARREMRRLMRSR